MADVNFLVGLAPLNAPHHIPAILNWIERNDCIHTGMVNVKVQQPKGAIVSPNGGMQGLMAIAVYASCTKEQFREIFGKPYDISLIPQIPDWVNKQEDKRINGSTKLKPRA